MLWMFKVSADFCFISHKAHLLLLLVTKSSSLLRLGDAYLETKVVDAMISRLPGFYKNVIQQYGRPSIWIRLWIPILAGGIFLVKCVKNVVSYRQSLENGLKEAFSTAGQFLENWLYEPMRRIWKTIRHEDSLQLTAGAGSLQADLAVRFVIFL